MSPSGNVAHDPTNHGLTTLIKKLLRRKRGLRERARESDSALDWNAFHTARTNTKTRIQTAKNQYMNNLGEHIRRNPKAVWRHLKKTRKNNTTIPCLLANGQTLTDPLDKAAAFNACFQGVFHPRDPTDADSLSVPCDQTLPFTVTVDGVRKLLQALPANKACGPDGISGDMLRITCEYSAACLTTIFNKSVTTGVIPDDWKVAGVVPVYKKGNRKDPTNYRPISLTSIPCKVLEHIIVSNLYTFFEENKLFSSSQFGFRRGSSCELLLTALAHHVTNWLDKGHQVDILLFDLRRAFDMVKYQKLFEKMENYHINRYIINWYKAFLQTRSQFVQLDGV